MPPRAMWLVSRSIGSRCRQALAALPVRQRTVLVLRYYCDLSEREIADEMRCSAGTVKSQAARGLAALRAQLSDTEMSTSLPPTQEATS